MKTPHFYAVIIGSEILNGRREDKHFMFIRNALLERGHTLFSSFIIKDNVALIRSIFTLIKNDTNGVLFSFGGIGSTPDDLTRAIAAEVFDDGELVSHPQFFNDIVERFGDEAYPHRINMANLPKKSKLLHNPINNMSGFYLKDRYFFMPGFPEMSHTMTLEALELFYPNAPVIYRKTLIAQTSENNLIEVMERLDSSVDFSSLPMINSGSPTVEISIASSNQKLCEDNFKLFIIDLIEKSIPFEVI
jgi:molybdopterin-biosynthesis enzyme MoeA-like protein